MRQVFWLGTAAVLMILTGCASVSVREAKVSKRAPQELPKHIYVSEFSTHEAVFNVDREGKELEDFKVGTVALLQSSLIQRLPDLAPSSKTPTVPPSQGWLVRGRIIRVNQGSRALRTGIGFGAGATKFETKVWVYDLGNNPRDPFLSFQTTGGSNAEPGAISGIGPATWFTVVGLGTGGVGNALHGVTEDNIRTSREIRNRLVDYAIDKKMVSAEWAKKMRPTVTDPRSGGSK